MGLKLLTTEEAATILGIKKNTLEGWRSQKTCDLPYIRIRGKVRYALDDVEKWIEKGRVHPAER